MRVIACIEDRRVIAQILGHVQVKRLDLTATAATNTKTARRLIPQLPFSISIFSCVVRSPEYRNCGATLRIIALIDDACVVERIHRHLKMWDPLPDPISPAGPDPPCPQGETLPLTYHPVPDIA